MSNQHFSYEQRSEEANAKLGRVYDLESARHNLDVSGQSDAQVMNEAPARTIATVSPIASAAVINDTERSGDQRQARIYYAQQEVDRAA